MQVSLKVKIAEWFEFKTSFRTLINRKSIMNTQYPLVIEYVTDKFSNVDTLIYFIFKY